MIYVNITNYKYHKIPIKSPLLRQVTGGRLADLLEKTPSNIFFKSSPKIIDCLYFFQFDEKQFSPLRIIS